MKINLEGCALPQPISVVSPEDVKEMLSIREEDGKVFVKINSSSLSLMQTCWRKTYLELIRKVKMPKDSSALDFGSAIHACLEFFYLGDRKSRKFTQACKKNGELIGAGVGTEEHQDCLVCNSFRKFVEVGRELGLSEDHMVTRSLPTGVWILTYYFERYIDDPFIVLEDAEGPLVERRVEYELYDSPELQINYFGSIDVILKNERTGVVLICDHKTSSRVGNEFFNRLKPNHQYTGYIKAAAADLGVETDSFLVNCLQVKPKPKTARGGPPQFPRQVTPRDSEDIKEFEACVLSTTKELIRRLKENDWPLGLTNSCAAWGGCTFMDVCSAPRDLRETIMRSKAIQFNEENA